MLDATIVLAAFGPAAVTDAAIRRARRITRDVVVYRPNHAAPHNPQDRVTQVPGTGWRAYVTALELGEPTRPVIHVHDDVLLTESTAVALLRCVRERGGIAVPYSNDLGTDHLSGPLPPVSKARPAVRTGRSSLTEARRASQVRTSCIAGSARHLRQLAAFRPHDAKSTLNVNSDDVECWVAPRALVAHDASCAEALAPPAGPDGRDLIVAAMIVRDEAEMLPGCLASLEALVDRVVVCDTGSLDDTVAIAERHGAHVIEREWRDDFGWARNQALDAVGDAWYVLSIDADERLETDEPEQLRRVLATNAGDVDAYAIQLADDAIDATWSTARLFRRDGYRWSGALHETIVSAPDAQVTPAVTLTGARIVHLGYSDDRVAERGKHTRNIDIAREAYESNPSLHNAIQYARSLGLTGERRDLQRELFERADVEGQHMPPESRAHVKVKLAQMDLVDDRPEDAFDRARAAVELVPADDEAAVLHARAATALGRHQDIVDMMARRDGARSRQAMFDLPAQRRHLANLQIGALAALGHVNDALDATSELLERHPDGFVAWPELVAAVAASEDAAAATERLAEVVLRDASGEAFGPIARELGVALAAGFCAAYVEAGGDRPEAVVTGVMAAAIRSDWQVFDRLVPYAILLDDEVLEGTAARLEARGEGDRAAQLRDAVSPALL